MGTNSKHFRTCQTQAPRFYIWNREILYVDATPSQPAPHRVAHDKLMISLSGEFLITVNGEQIRSRSCLMRTGEWHDQATVDCSNAIAATWLLPPFSQDVPALTRMMTCATPGIYYNHPRQTELIDLLQAVREIRETDPEHLRRTLRQSLLTPDVRSQVFRAFDPRVLKVVRRVRQTVSINLPLERFAAEVELSESYLEKLFKEHTGLPITQFRLRYRTYVSAILLGMGYSITDAALKAGFSSSSHFSRTHRAMTGETASKLFIQSGAETFIERKVIKSVLQIIRGTAAGRTMGEGKEASGHDHCH